MMTRILVTMVLLSGFSAQADLCHQVLSQAPIKPATRAVLDAGPFNVIIKSSKSELKDHKMITLEFGDGYMQDLFASGWSKEQISNLDQQIYAALKTKTADIHQEDKELFEIDLSVKDMADPVLVIKERLAELLKKPLTTEQVEAVMPEMELAKKEIELAYQAIRASERKDETLISIYTKDYHNHFSEPSSGFVILETSQIFKKSSLSFSEKDFVRDFIKIVTKPGTILVKISTARKAFFRINGDSIIPKEQFFNFTDSKLMKLIRELDSEGGAILKMESRATVSSGDGEEVMLLATPAFTQKLADHLNALMKDL